MGWYRLLGLHSDAGEMGVCYEAPGGVRGCSKVRVCAPRGGETAAYTFQPRLPSGNTAPVWSHLVLKRHQRFVFYIKCFDFLNMSAEYLNLKH